MRTTLRRVLFFICLLSTITTTAQVSVGATSYTTLKAAFDAINAGTYTGAITINISGNTVESATATLNASGTGSASYTNIAINASAAATISSNLAVATILLNGADNVNLNGNSVLTIVNSHTTGAVISLVNDATSNTIRNTSITGNTASYSGTAAQPIINGGVITFGSGTTGNNGNMIENCDINGNNQGICLIYSESSSSVNSNKQNTIRNSRLYNYINNAVAGAVGMFLLGAEQWTIEGNSLYFTSAVNTGQQFIFRGILIRPTFGTDTHTVTGNFFGGNGPSASGMMTVNATGSNMIGFFGIHVEASGTGNTVSNNTVKNVALNYNMPSATGSFSNTGIFGFIGGYNGTISFTGNEVNNISITNTSGFVNFNGMHLSGRVIAAASTVAPSFTATNNTITNINGNSGGASGDVNMHGIRLEASSAGSLTNTSVVNPSFNVTGNVISNISVPFDGNIATYIRGIGTVLTNGTSAPSTAILLPKVTITNNTVHSLSTSSTMANYASGVVTGIHFGGASSGTTDVQVISQNTVYNLAATNTGNFGAVVVGILANTGMHEITRNRVYDLRNAATASGSTTPGIVGINVRSATGTSTTANNFISLGTGVGEGVQVFGFLQNVSDAGPVNVYHNSIYIGGTAAAGDKRSAALIRGTELFGAGITTPMNVKNNILYNTRTGGGGSHYAIVNAETAPSAGFTSDGNVLYTSNPFTLARWGATNNDLATYKTNSGDMDSRTVTVNFANTTTGDLHLTGASVGDNNLGASPVPGILIDYDGDARSLSRVYIGADELSAVLPVTFTSFTGYREGIINKLVWTTATESNNKFFELQRSADGRNFTTIATIYSKAEGGNSNTNLSYSYTDEKVFAGVSYYRLKQTDNDGRSNYATVIVSIRRDRNSFEVSSVYPNPAKDAIQLRISSPLTDKASITIIDLAGKVSRQISSAVVQGENNLSIDVTALPAGTYIVRVINGKAELRTLQFVKH